MKRLVLGIFFLLILVALLIPFLFFKAKNDINYAENSLLYQYYEDYHYANRGNDSFDIFMEFLQKKDSKLYDLLKKRKIVFFFLEKVFFGKSLMKKKVPLTTTLFLIFYSQMKIFL